MYVNIAVKIGYNYCRKFLLELNPECGYIHQLVYVLQNSSIYVKLNFKKAFGRYVFTKVTKQMHTKALRMCLT